MLYVGEEFGALRRAPTNGTASTSRSIRWKGPTCAPPAPTVAIAVLAAAERGGLLHAPDVYMEKIVVGPTAAGRIHIDAPVAENLRNIADAFERDVDDLTVVVLDRDRHRQLIDDIRSAGARIRLIGDGDLSAGIAAAVRGTGVHAVMGIGGAPEGVLTAAALRCLGGEIQGRLMALNDAQLAARRSARDHRPRQALRHRRAGARRTRSCSAPAASPMASCCGASASSATAAAPPRSSCRGHAGIIRFVDTIHREDATHSSFTDPGLFR